MRVPVFAYLNPGGSLFTTDSGLGHGARGVTQADITFAIPNNATDVCDSGERNPYLSEVHQMTSRALSLFAMAASILSVACIGAPAPQQEQIRKIVDGVARVKALPPKVGEPQDDEHAAAIVKLGRKAGPYLVDKIVDRSPTEVVQGFSYKVGDVAVALLTEIYRPKSWPFPDGSFKLPERYGDFRDYVDFVNSPGGPRRLQRSWRQYIRAH